MSKVARWVECALYGFLYLVVSFSPLLSNVTLRRIPGALSLLDTVGLSVAAVSWAFLVYFAWAYLPSLNAPDRERLREWAVFLGLELAYPAVCWGGERSERVYLTADILTYASTCITLSTTSLLWLGWYSQFEESSSQAWGNFPVLLVCFGFITLPGLLGEISWWKQVELDNGVVWASVRLAGLALGTVGVTRNLLRAKLF